MLVLFTKDGLYKGKVSVILPVVNATDLAVSSYHTTFCFHKYLKDSLHIRRTPEKFYREADYSVMKNLHALRKCPTNSGDSEDECLEVVSASYLGSLGYLLNSLTLQTN